VIYSQGVAAFRNPCPIKHYEWLFSERTPITLRELVLSFEVMSPVETFVPRALAVLAVNVVAVQQ